MPKRIGYQLTCDRCDVLGVKVFANEGQPVPDAEQPHLCKGTVRPTWRPLKYRSTT